MSRNPFVDLMKVLGTTPGAFQAAKNQVEIFFKANDDKEVIDEAVIRAAVQPAVSDRIWNEIKKALGFALVLILLFGGYSGSHFEVEAFSIKTGSDASPIPAEHAPNGKGKVKALP